jgi:tetratricopeptide (TPR) repeat protein
MSCGTTVRPRLTQLAVTLLGALVVATSAGAQTPALARALDLENGGKMREAATAFREAYAAAGTDDEVRLSAILGLERALSSIGQVDSLLPVLLPALRLKPRDPTLRSIQLRSLHTLGREDEVRMAFDSWRAAAPGDAAPFREYAQQLLAAGRAQAADTVLKLAERQLRGSRELVLEVAQLHSALGMWAEAGASWRTAMMRLNYAEAAAIFSLQAAPQAARDSVRLALVAPPVALAPRRVAATLLLAWRQPTSAWDALAALTPDDSTIAAWRDFAEKAEDNSAWSAARSAWARLAEVRRDPGLMMRAASAALAAGDPTDAVRLLDLASDSASTRTATLLRIEALARAGRAQDATRLATDARARLDVGDRAHVASLLADAWVRAGDVAQARAALTAAGDAGEGSAGGWLALYSGDLKQARTLLRRTDDAPSADPAIAMTALAVLARTRVDSAPALGAAFLSAARGDSAKAAELFEAAGRTLPDAASLLFAASARLYAARRDTASATRVWESIVATYPESPEAPEAELSWARVLLARGDRATAATKLEHLIITYPRSALVPIARRELDRARAAGGPG